MKKSQKIQKYKLEKSKKKRRNEDDEIFLASAVVAVTAISLEKERSFFSRVSLSFCLEKLFLEKPQRGAKLPPPSLFRINESCPGLRTGISFSKTIDEMIVLTL